MVETSTMARGESSIAPLTVIVIGTGQMGSSHLLAYHRHPGYKVIGIVARRPPKLQSELQQYEAMTFTSLDEALRQQPDVVSINSYSDSHAEYAVAAMNAGAHVFVEKPLATTVADARRVVETAQRTGKKLVIGYILRHHPSWVRFISEARKLGAPFVMRMNLNQRSSGEAWEIHKRLLKTASPVIDCGVHYIDVMLQVTDSRPVQVRGMGVRLTDEIETGQVNYGHLQIVLEDGSVGWYEAGWGPMISETAHFVKDIFGPNGSVSIVANRNNDTSADVGSHTQTANILVRKVGEEDRMLSMEGEPGHDQLCALEQEYLFQAIRQNSDLTEHMKNAITSLEIVLAADLSMRQNRAVDLT